jgi:hypothetical protein
VGNIDDAIDRIRPYADKPFHLILSSEGFANLPVESQTKFGERLRDLGYTTRCLVFFRPQYELVVSSYLQHIKSDKVEHSQTLREYALSRHSNARNPFNWLERVKRLERAYRDVSVKW